MKKSFRLQFCSLLAPAVLSVVAMAPSVLASPGAQTATPTTQAAPPTPQNDEDDVGYIDCQSHPENTQVLAKAAKTREVVTSLPCGERFTIVLYGFFFSRIQTKHGKVGYVFSYLISRDHSATSVRQPTSAQAPAPTSNIPVTSATVVKPEPTTPTQPQPTPAQPAAQAPWGAGAGPGLGRPIPPVRREPVVELFGGYAYVRFDSGGYINGALGSLGWNVKPWLQIATETSYSLGMASRTKAVLYGGHLGPRFFHRGRNKWGASPFIEALFGRSRLDTTIRGPGGYQISDRAFSIKVGGGLDLNISPHFAIRLFDVDYYRTPFIFYSQNNYWASTGIVLRLGGGRPQ